MSCYLYADATPFPLESNFIQTLIGVVDACVALYECDATLERERAANARARHEAVAELAQLERLLHNVNASVAPFTGPALADGVRQTAAAIANSVTGAVNSARQRASAASRRASTARPEPQQVSQWMAALGQFLVAHELPHTQWSIRWRVRDGLPGAELVARTEQLVASFVARIPGSSAWSRAIPVAQLIQRPAISITRTRGRKQQQVAVPLNLSRLEVVEVSCRPERASFVLAAAGKKTPETYLVTYRSSEARVPYVEVRVDGTPVEPRQAFSGADADAVRELGAAIESRLQELRGMRAVLNDAMGGGHSFRDVERPSDIADALLAVVAPYVREMRQRSRIPTELILKRDLGNHRREEIFLPRAVLIEKQRGLDVRYRRAFESVGLGDDSVAPPVERGNGQMSAAGSIDTGNAEPDPYDSIQIDWSPAVSVAGV